MRTRTLALAGLTVLLGALVSPANAIPDGGVNDLNDGWIHIVEPQNAALDGVVLTQITPDENGDLVIQVETWYVGAVGQLPYRLEIAGDDFPHSGLAFSNADTLIQSCVGDAAGCAAAIGPASSFYSTGRAGVQPEASADGKTHTYRVPLADLQAAGGDLTAGFAVWHDLQYKPRVPGGALYSGGAPSSSRGDHKGADDDLCRAGEDPWVNCPASGGYASNTKNALFFAGFGDRDPRGSEGDDADGTPYGTNDEVVGALGGASNGLVAEAGLKGQVDRQEYTLTSTAA